MQNELIAQGLSLMALGMGVVFIFLALLVVTTYSMSAIIGRFFPEVVAIAESNADDAPLSSGELPDARTLTIIQKALLLHRKGLHSDSSQRKA